MVAPPIERFYRRISFSIPIEQWHRLPRVTSHKNEYWDGCAQLTPRPKSCSVVLRLDGWQRPPRSADGLPDKPSTVRPLVPQDWAVLPGVFHSAFARLQPLSSWNGHAGATGSRAIVNWTRLGRDGPLVNDACFVATDPDGRDGGLCAAALVTMAPVGRFIYGEGGLGAPDPARPDQKIVPHLTWMFVSMWSQRRGIGTALLTAVAGALRSAGHPAMTSTIALDNPESLQWHWRNGFEMLSRGF